MVLRKGQSSGRNRVSGASNSMSGDVANPRSELPASLEAIRVFTQALSPLRGTKGRFRKGVDICLVHRSGDRHTEAKPDNVEPTSGGYPHHPVTEHRSRSTGVTISTSTAPGVSWQNGPCPAPGMAPGPRIAVRTIAQTRYRDGRTYGVVEFETEPGTSLPFLRLTGQTRDLGGYQP